MISGKMEGTVVDTSRLKYLRRMTMNIYAPRGSQVLFHAQGGYDHEQELAKLQLKVGAVYTVDRTEVGRSSTKVWLKGIDYPSGFNSVLFNDYPPQKDIFVQIVDRVIRDIKQLPGRSLVELGIDLRNGLLVTDDELSSILHKHLRHSTLELADEINPPSSATFTED